MARADYLLTPIDEEDDYPDYRLTPVDDLDVSDDQGADDYRLTPVDEADDPSTYERIGRGLSRGTDQLQGLLYSATEFAGEKAGSDLLTNFGSEGAARNQREAESVGRAPEFTDIRSLSDFYDWGVESLATVVPMVAPAAIGALAGGTGLIPIGAVAGAFIGGLPLGVGEVQQNIKEKDPLAEGKGAYVLGAGSAIAALDAVLPGLVVGRRLAQIVGRDAAENIARKTLEKPVKERFIKRTATGAAEGMVVEGATEALQESIAEYAAASATNEPIRSDIGKQLVEAAAAGALFGGVTGGVSSAFDRGPRAEPSPHPPADRGPSPVTEPLPPGPQPAPAAPLPAAQTPPPAPQPPQPALSEDDRASPIPDDKIIAGEALIERLTGQQRPEQQAVEIPIARPVASVQPVRREAEQSGVVDPGFTPQPSPLPAPVAQAIRTEQAVAGAPTDQQPVTTPAPVQQAALTTAPVQQAPTTPEPAQEAASVNEVHAAARDAGIEWDDSPDFMNFTHSITGKDRLDALTPRQITAVKTAIESGQRPKVFRADDYESALRRYIRTPGKPITIGAIAKSLGVQPKQAAEVFNIVASAANSPLQAGKNGAWRRRARSGKPLDIVQFIASRGGLRESGGELAARDYGKVFVPGFGKLQRKNGMDPVDASRLAQEFGYLAPDAPNTVSTLSVNDFMEAMDETISRRRRVYSWDGSVESEMDDPRALEANERAREDVLDFAREAGLLLSAPDMDAVLAMMGDGMNAEDAVTAYFEREGDSAADAIYRETGDPQYEEELPFGEDRVDAEDRAGREGDARDEGESREGRPRAGEDRRISGEEAGRPEAVLTEVKDAGDATPARTEIDRTEAGEQTVLPGAERTEQAAAAKRQADAKAEMDVRQRQSKLRRGGQESVRDQDGGLFSAERDQNQLFSVEDGDAAPTTTPEFRKWFGKSKVVDESGRPVMVFHGGAADFEIFNNQDILKKTGTPIGAYVFSSSAENAGTYAFGDPDSDRLFRDAERFRDKALYADDDLVRKFYMDQYRKKYKLWEKHLEDKKQGRQPIPPSGANIIPVYLSMQNPLIMDAQGRGWFNVSGGNNNTGEIANPLFDGDENTGAPGPSGQTLYTKDPRGKVPSHNINYYAKKAMEGGYDGLIVRNVIDTASTAKEDRIVQDTYFVFSPKQIKSVYNRGSFDAGDPRISFGLGDGATPAGTPETASREDIHAALRDALNNIGLRDVALELAGVINSPAQAGSVTAGNYDAVKNLITVSMRAADKVFTLNHEAIHALRGLGLFSKSEWSILRNRAMSDKPLLADIRRRYASLNLTEEGIAEEVIADMFASWRRGDFKPHGMFERVMARIEKFFEAVRNALQGAGFRTADEVFDAIERGEVGARERQAADGQGGVKFSKQDDLFGKSFDGPQEFAWEYLKKKNKGLFRRSELAMMAKDAVSQKLQDKFIHQLRTQEAILKKTGETKLDESVDVRLAEEIYHSKVGSALKRFDRDEIRPLVAAMQAERLTVADVDIYIYARHAPYRNARIALIDPAMPDGGSGMTNADAAEIMDQPKERIEALDRIAKRVDAIIEATLKIRVESGLMSNKQAAEWRAALPYYAPLRGLAEADTDAQDSPARPNIGRGFDIRGPESRRALGRRSRATDILINVLTSYEEALVRGGRNEVGQTMYRLVEKYPNPKFWEINRPDLVKRINNNTGMVEYVPDPSFKNDDNVMSVKIDGKPVYIAMHHGGLARAMKNVGVDTGNELLRTMQRLMRWLAFVYTSANIDFILSNFERDLMTAGINLQSVPEAEGLTTKIIKSTPAAIAGSYRAIRGLKANKWSADYEEFAAEGGATAFFALDDIDAQRKRINALVQDMNKKGGLIAVKRVALAAEKIIQDANAAVESGVRLSTYVALRDAGVSKKHAASAAKNLTVNFNRRGEWAGTASALYLFYNASIQGSVRLIHALKYPRVQKIVGGIIVTSAILDIVNGLLSPEDDDGEKGYDKISQYTKDHNIILINPFGDGADVVGAKITVPYGHNVFFALGTKVGEQVRSALGIGPKRDPWGQAADISLTALNAFNPIGGSDTVLGSFMPTLLKPFYEIEVNRNFMGAPIYPEPNPFGIPEPDSERYFKSVSDTAKWFAREMNSLTGGDEVRPGAIDVSPKTLDHFFKFVTGGTGKFVENTGDFFYKAMTGRLDDVEWRNVPLAGRVIEGKNTYYERQRYYEIRDAADIADAQLRLKMRKQDADGAQSVLQNYAPEIKAKAKFDQSDKMLAKLRKAQKEVDGNPDMPDEKRRIITDAILAQSNAIMADSVLFYNQSDE